MDVHLRWAWTSIVFLKTGRLTLFWNDTLGHSCDTQFHDTDLAPGPREFLWTSIGMARYITIFDDSITKPHCFVVWSSNQHQIPFPKKICHDFADFPSALRVRVPGTSAAQWARVGVEPSGQFHLAATLVVLTEARNVTWRRFMTLGILYGDVQQLVPQFTKWTAIQKFKCCCCD